MARHISRIAAVFDAAPIGVGVWSVRGELLHANPVLADLLGSDAASVRGRVFEEHLRADDVPGVRRMVGDLWDGTRNSFECDVRCVAPGGAGPVGAPTSRRFTALPAARVPHLPDLQLQPPRRRGDGDRPAGARAAGDAVAGRRAWHPAPATAPRSSSSACRRARRAAASSLFEDVDHDDVDPVRAEVRRAIDAHQPWTFTARSRRADDTWRWMRHDARPRIAADGACIGFAGVSVDVTDDQERRRELEEVQRLFSSVTDAGPIAVLRTDRAGNVTYANGRWAEILDDPATRLRETSWQSILVPEHVDELVRRSAQAVRLGRPFVMRVQAVEPLTGGSGPATTGASCAAPVYDDDGRHDGFVATLTDISAEVAADRRADRLAAVLDAGLGLPRDRRRRRRHLPRQRRGRPARRPTGGRGSP
ncbi:MAG: PAS domain-containing protein [Acidimicrobiales bacterium]